MKRSMALMVTLCLLGVGCSSSGDDKAATSSTTSTVSTTASADTGPATDQITVMVTNDDGVSAQGIDAVVKALDARDDVKVVVVAPAKNQSGSGGKTTEGTLETEKTTTASGFPATAVKGYPADTVVWALGDGGLKPDLVVSGANNGQNIGPLIPLSGTVGAARQAAQKGVPAVAVSQGLGDPPDYAIVVQALMKWLDDNIDKVRNGRAPTDEVPNINAPNCSADELQGTVDVPPATSSTVDLNSVDCAGTAKPTDDVTAFVNGWIAVSELPPTGSNT